MNASTDELTVRDAMSILRRDYYQEVKGIADELIAHARELYIAGKLDDEALLTWLHETIGETQRVIYTGQAMQGLLVSENDSAAVDALGPDGLVFNDSINWAGLMFYAMLADITEALDHEGFDLNDPDAYFGREEHYARAAKEHGESAATVRMIAEDESFFDDDAGHGEWLDAATYAEFSAWFATALEEHRRQAADA